jgi:hypothetical protein
LTLDNRLLGHGIYGYIIRVPPARPVTYIPFTVSPVLMQYMPRYIAPVFLVIMFIVLLCSGCTSPSGIPSGTPAATPSPAGNLSLAPLALTPADLPAGFVQQSGRYKSPDEVSAAAKYLGWQEGYVANFTSAGNASSGTTTITQTITQYNTTNMTELVGIVSANEEQQTGLGFIALAPPSGIPGARAINAIVVNISGSSSSVGGGILPVAQAASAPATGYMEVIFGKGQVFEVIRMTGPGAQYNTLAALAQTAYAKSG